jgi:hypothetical protein
MTPYERIDVLEQALKVLVARVDALEKHRQQGDVHAPADKAVPGTTLHLPPNGKH